jgi:hypothetical protein
MTLRRIQARTWKGTCSRYSARHPELGGGGVEVRCPFVASDDGLATEGACHLRRRERERDLDNSKPHWTGIPRMTPKLA